MASNRTVKTSLVAEVSGYIAGYEKAAKATRDLGTEAEKLAAKKDAINQLGAGLLAIGAVAAVGVGMAVKAFSDFDSAMSAVKANTQETAANMALLREAAIDFGASSIFTATESANAIEELGKAGTTTAAILGGALASSLDLAASSGLGIARAAEIVATTSSQFNLAGDQAGRISDTLAAGAGKALGSVDDLANGLKFVGPVASSMGVSLEETTGVLALFAKAGIVGEQGGTSLRGMLSSLTSPSKQAAAEIQELGIQLYDAQGKFLGLENVAGQLSGAYSGMKDQARDASLGVLFGNEQITAARVLYEGGAEAVNTWTAAVTDNGYAARIAADRLDNLAGDVEKLGGAFDSALIKSGSGANDILRTLTQTATSLVDAIGDTPTPVLNVGLALGGVVAATGLVGGAALIAVPKIAAFKTGLKDLGVSGPVAARGIGIAAGAVTVLTLGLSIFIAEQAKAKAKVDEYASSLAASSGKIDANTRAIATNNLASKQGWWIFESESTFDAATKLGISLDVVTDAALGNLTALKTIQSATTLGTAGSKKLSDQMKETGLSAVELSQASIAVTSGVKGEASSIEEAIRVAKQKASVDSAAAAGSSILAAGLATLGLNAEDAAAGTEELTAAVAAQTQELADADAAFVDLNGAYDILTQKNQEVAQATADATESADDSWEDYYDGFSFSLAEYLTELQTMVDAQNNWETNMILLSGRVSAGLLDELAKMGPEGAEIVAGLVEGTDEQLAQAESLWAERGSDATGAFARVLSESGPVIRAAAEQLGMDAAREIAAKLDAGTSTVEQIITEYGLIVANMNPVIQVDTSTAAGKIQSLGNLLGSLAMPTIPVPSAYPNANGNIHAYASGGFPTGIYAGRAGSIHKFAEPETGWEAYISGRPGQEARNASIAFESLDRLGVPAPTYVPASDRQYASAGSSSTTKTLQHTTNINGVGVSLSEAQAAAEFDRNQALRGL